MAEYVEEERESARMRISDEESDFYALVIAEVLMKLFPERGPEEVADAVLSSFSRRQVGGDG